MTENLSFSQREQTNILVTTFNLFVYPNIGVPSYISEICQKRIVDLFMIVLLLFVCLFGGILLALSILLPDCCGMMLAFMWLGISIWHRRGDTLDFPPMAMSVFHIEHRHYFADFALKPQVYKRLADLCSYVHFFLTIKI